MSPNCYAFFIFFVTIRGQSLYLRMVQKYTISEIKNNNNFLGRLPPDPTKEKSTNAEDMARFFIEFKNLVLSECDDRMEAEKQDQFKIKNAVKEQMMEDG